MPATPALTLSISLPGLDPLIVALSRVRATIADWRPFWTQTFSPFFYRWVRTDFVVEGGQSGNTWAPLSSAYATWKARRFPGQGILVRSGALKAALTSPDAEGSIFRPTSTSLEIGTSLGYAMYHQTGTSRMPQRPPLRVNEAFMGVIGKGLQVFVQQAWAQRQAATSVSAA